MPVGAIGGKRKIMEKLAPTGDVYQAGTLSGNPLAMSAGLTTLNILKTKNVSFAELDDKTNYPLPADRKPVYSQRHRCLYQPRPFDVYPIFPARSGLRFKYCPKFRYGDVCPLFPCMLKRGVGWRRRNTKQDLCPLLTQIEIWTGTIDACSKTLKNLWALQWSILLIIIKATSAAHSLFLSRLVPKD